VVQTKKRLFHILIEGFIMGSIFSMSGLLEISRLGLSAQAVRVVCSTTNRIDCCALGLQAPAQVLAGCLMFFTAATLYIKRSKYQFQHFEISCLLWVYILLFMIQSEHAPHVMTAALTFCGWNSHWGTII